MGIFDGIGQSSNAPAAASGSLWAGVETPQTTTNQPSPFFTPSTPDFGMAKSTPAVTAPQVNPQPQTFASSFWGTALNTIKGLPDAATTVGKALPGIALSVAQAIPRALISTGMTVAQALPRPEQVVSKVKGLFDDITGAKPVPAPTDPAAAAKQSVLSNYPLTPAAKDIVGKTQFNIGMQPDGVGATTHLSNPAIWNTQVTLSGKSGSDITAFNAAYESFNTIFLHSNTNPADFNKVWAAAAKTSPEMQEIDKELNDPTYAAAFNGNGENVSTDAYQLASERFAQLGSKFGVDGLQSIPQGMQSYYKAYVADTSPSQASQTVSPSLGGAFAEFFLGKDPITSLQTQAQDLQSAFPNMPSPLIALGVATGDVLNFLPGGGEESVIKALTRTTDITEAASILRQVGVQEDLIQPAAEKFVSLTKPAEVKAGLQSLADFQQTTKISNIKAEIEVTQDAIDNSPARGLVKYYKGADPNTTNLDQIFATGVKRGNGSAASGLDAIVQERGFSTVQEAHDAVLADNAAKVKVAGLKATLKDLVKPGTTADTIEEALKTRASQEAPLGAAGHEPQLPTVPKSRVAPIQDTINKVELGVKGTGVAQRVRSAIGASEAIKTQVINKGQDAYLAGRGLSKGDMKLAEQFEHGTPVTDITSKADNPARLSQYIMKLSDYYDFRLAADRAAGGSTPRVENYLPHTWDLTKPEDAARFNELATQKGLQPYDGFRSQPRVFDSYAEGEAAGFKRTNPDINADLRADYHGASNAISRQALRQGLNEAAPHMVSASGYGKTESGAAFKNSNIPGLEGISYHPTIAKLLQGYEPLRNADFIKLVKRAGAEAAIDKSGLGKMIDATVAAVKSVPKNAAESGILGTMGSVWHGLSAPAKQILWNWSGFHSANISLNFMGASITHPIDAAKGLAMSVAAALSERADTAVTNYFKNTLYKDSTGAESSIYDWAVKAGALEARELPAEGAAKFNPFTANTRAIFDREIPKMALQLSETFGAKRGIVPDSPEGLQLGQEIRNLLGEINTKTSNINPNNLRIASHLLLAPGFTYSKAATTLDALTKWGGENKAAGALARNAVIGKSVLIGTLATAITLISKGQLPSFGQILLNYTINPSSQTNLTNPKGKALDITFPKSFVSEWAGLLTSPDQYLEARLNPFLADGIKLYTNQDYNGQPIVNPNVPQSKAMQIAKNLGIGHLPIGAQSVVNQLMGKQTGVTSAIQVVGGNTRISESDPTKQKYAAIDKAQVAIEGITPDDPNRIVKMQAIFNSIPADSRKSLAYQELMSGVSTKGIYTSATEQKYFDVQAKLAAGDTAGATAITKAMTKAEYTTYKSIKTKAAHEALFSKVAGLVKSGDVAGATKLTSAMTKDEYKSYQTWKKNQ